MTLRTSIKSAKTQSAKQFYIPQRIDAETAAE